MPKTLDVYFSGKLSTYQSRRILTGIFHGDDSIRLCDALPYPKSNVDYESYAKNLNSSYIAIGGCMQDYTKIFYKGVFIGNTFMRNIEIPAAGACLLNTPFGDKTVLGFKNGINCIIVKDYSKVLETVKYYLDDKELLAKITKKGYDLVHEKYSSEMVVDEFIKELNGKYN
jgi:spore maturation protein CgeB